MAYLFSTKLGIFAVSFALVLFLCCTGFVGSAAIAAGAGYAVYKVV